jgi:prepilin-type N-terminal cleavage/methylation domain-containing protein
MRNNSKVTEGFTLIELLVVIAIIVQYLPPSINAWKLHLTFKGRVTSIGPTTQTEVPQAVMEVIEK